MGLLGRYLDSLPDEARDRIIEAQNWGIGTLVDAEGNRCVLGHAEDWIFAGSLLKNHAGAPDIQWERTQQFGPSSHLEIGRRFDTLCHRHDVQTLVGQIKRRAGRATTPAELRLPRETPAARR